MPTSDGLSPQSGGQPPELNLKEYLDLYKVYRAYVMEESGLINSRLTWIITINGFLFATYGFTLQKEIEVTRAYAVLGSGSPAPSVFINTMMQAELFLLTISILGFCIGILGWISIRSAQKASDAVADMFRSDGMSAHTTKKKDGATTAYKTKDGYILPPIRGGGVIRSIKHGHRPSRWMPLLFAISWGASLAILLAVWRRNQGLY